MNHHNHQHDYRNIFLFLFSKKLIRDGVPGNKWLNIEIGQNTMEVGDPLLNLVIEKPRMGT